MTSAQPITVLLQPYLQQGLSLWLEGEMLRFKATKELMTPALMGLLKQNKEAIIEWLKSEATGNAAEPKKVDEFPLASTQGAIWMLYRFAPNSPAYNTTFACTLKGELNETAVRQAFHALMIRHPMLRTTFIDTDHGPRQQVWDHIDMPLQLVDGSQWSASALDQWLTQEADAPFDLTKTSCLRVKIVRNSVRGNVLIATIQHVGADLWALLIVAKDIKEFYQRAAQGDVLSLQPTTTNYRQHVEWQQQFLLDERGKSMRRFWQRALQGAPTQVSFPVDFPRPPVLQLKTALNRQLVSGDTYRAIKDFCKRNSITPYVFVQTALQLLIYHHTSAPDFLLGTPTMGRSQKGMDQVVGDFANPVVLRARIQPQQSMRELLQTGKRTLLDAMEYQDYPFPAVVQDCNPPRDSSRTPLFQVMFVWHQGNAELLAQDDWIGDVLPLSGPRGAPYDVMLAVSDLADHFELNWTYQISLYRPETIERIGQMMQQLLTQMMQPDVKTVDDCLNALQLDITATVSDAQKTTSAALVESHPVLAEYPHCIVKQESSDGRSLQRLFIECAAASLPDGIRVLLEQDISDLDDVMVLPNLPYGADGKINHAVLRQLPWVDRQVMLRHLQNKENTAEQAIVLRDRVLIPTAEPSEIAAFQQRAKVVALPRKIDISQRADAWVTGAPLQLPEDSPNHLFAALCRSAERFPERGLTLINDDRNVIQYRYPELVADARRVAAALKKLKQQSGAILLLQMRFDQRFFAVWWGALLAGLRPLNVATPEQYTARNGVAQKLYNVAHNYAELTVAADHERLAETRQWLGASKPVIDADVLLQETDICLDEPGGDAVAFLQLTSGSTGTPKAIQITHHGILHHVAASAIHNQYSADDINLNWLPFDHVVPILTTHIKDCVLGIQQIQLTTRSVLADPVWWLQAMSDYGVTHSWAPNFAFQRVAEALEAVQKMPELNLQKVKWLMNAGEQVLAPVVNRFYAACEPLGLQPHRVQPAFGMAEACTCITYNNNSSERLSIHFNPTSESGVCDINEPHLSSHGFVDLGTLMPGVEIRITNENNALVKEGVIGRMQIRGPEVTPGYLNNPDANAEAFVGDGWFNSGDLGFIWNKRLILTGREKEMIVVNGANYYCFELEQAATISGVVPTFVAATGVSLEAGTNSDALVVFYVSDHTVDAVQLERQMAARIAEAFGIPPAYLIDVSADDFHKTTSGKIQRGQFKKNFEKHHYADQMEAYQERHRKNDDRVTSLFDLHWESRARSASIPRTASLIWVEPTLASHHTISRWQNDGAVLQPLQWDTLHASLVVANNTRKTQVMVLGQLDSRPHARPLIGEALIKLTGVFAQFKTCLLQADAAERNALLLVVIGSSRDDVLLVKPLVETLRQETGLAQLQACVVAEEFTDVHALDIVASGGGSVRWIENASDARPLLRSVNLNTRGTHVIVSKGVYVITGGLGGLSESLCAYLILQKRCKVILLGRSDLTENARRCYRFQQWQKLFGADNLHYRTLQGWNPQALHQRLQPLLADLKASQVDGFFHLAGHLDMQALEAIDQQQWQQQVEPKLAGSCCVTDYLQQHAPKAILVHYSSLNGFFGGQNAAAYSLANGLQTVQTSCNNAGSTIRTWCLHWSVWANTGMATQFSTTDLQLARNKGLMPLDKSRDLFWLDVALSMPPANYYIGIDPAAAQMRPALDFNVQVRDHFHVHVQASSAAQNLDVARWVAEPAFCIDALRVEQHLWQEPWPTLASGKVDWDQLVQMGRAHDECQVPPENDTERGLIDIWTAVLNRSIPDVTRSFFEYGGHSINATQLVAAINQRFDLKLTVAHLFQYPSIRALTGIIAAPTDNTSAMLPLGLSDFIARADGYRIDCINPASDATANVVFLPTASGLASAYLTLMSPLSNARLFVLGMPLSHDQAETPQTVAGQFVDLMDQSGLDFDNTLLVGWSMGGVLGYEVLQQLHKKQRPIPRLLMLDSGFGVGLHTITFDPDFQLLMFAVELGLGAENFAEFNQFKSTNQKLEWLKQYLLTIGIEVTQAKLLEWSEAYRIRLQQLEHHTVDSQTLIADITLIKATWHSHGRDDLGWGDANKNIKWQSVAADHQGIVKHPEVANWLRQRYVQSEKTNGNQ